MEFSAVVLVKNHRTLIRGCLETLRWVDEILVINDNSSDGTIEIARQFPNVAVMDREMAGHWARQMNFGIRNARGEWILHLDVDERIPDPLAREIQDAAQNPRIHGMGIRFLGVTIGGLFGGDPGAPHAARIVRRGHGEYEDRRVHARLVVDGPVHPLQELAVHLGPYPDSQVFFRKNTFYADLEARSNIENGVRLVGDSFPAMVKTFVLKPAGVFLRKYLQFRRKGWPGFHFAVLRAIGYYMVYLRTWELQNDIGMAPILEYCRRHGIPTYADAGEQETQSPAP